jgi:pimeloyl-ACP methyl ester carboxylesterase
VTIFGRRVFNGAPPAGWAEHALSVLAAPGVIHGWMMEAKHMDVKSLHAEDVDVPTTIVQGDADALSPMAVASTLHRAIPSSSLVAVPGGTHMLPITHADLLVNQVRMLASRIRAADSHAAVVPLAGRVSRPGVQ